MKCCNDPHVYDHEDLCGCVVEACFNCYLNRMVSFCKKHNPGANEP